MGAIVLETVRSSPLAVPFGVLLFLWQWERLIFYAGDVEDGAVPDDLPLPIFLSVFASPPIVFAWARGFTVGQAYAYQDASFLAVDKNRLVLRGLALWALGFTYLLLSDAAVIALGDAAGRLLGTRVYTLFPELLERELGNSEVPAATVLASTFLSQLRWYLSKAGPMHFMVGSFRILGYDVAAHYDAPLLATNLVSLWARFTFHYREFLGRVFYYPVFLRLARWPMSVRIVLATFAAAGLGNWLWGHAVHASASAGMSGSAFLGTLRMWPYFLLLSAGISVTEVYLLLRGRKARKPWTPGWRLVLDVVAAYATFQFFGLIEIFFFSVKFPERSVTEHAALFLRAFGI